MTHCAIDLGITNTVMAEWRDGQAYLVDLPTLTVHQGLGGIPIIPSAICVPDECDQKVLVGRPAVETEAGSCLRSFKYHLLQSNPTRTVHQVDGRNWSAIDIAAAFLQGVLAFQQRRSEMPITGVTIPAPVEAFETYRTALRRGPEQELGAITLHSLDEPVAAAIGYGVDVKREQVVLFVDFGGAMLNLSLVRTGWMPGSPEGRATCLAKDEIFLGGDDFDQWLARAIVERSDQNWSDLKSQHARLIRAAEAAKIALSTHEQALFSVLQVGIETTITRNDFEELLTRRKAYQRINKALAQTLRQAAARGIEATDIDQVLLVGGSTLLPSVQALFVERFGRERVKSDQPFTAVVLGAACFGAGTLTQDFIQHTYVLRVRNPKTGKAGYEKLIPRGTLYPTARDFVVRDYPVLTPGRRPVDAFRLLVYEVGGQDDSGSAELTIRSEGNVEWLNPVALTCINESNPVLVQLDPPEPAGSDYPRVRIAFSVRTDRRLYTSIHDLRQGKNLISEQPIAELQ